MLFDPDTEELTAYRLSRGRYVLIRPDTRGQRFSERLGLGFGVYEGTLRLFTKSGELVPLPDEAAQRAMAKAEHLAKDKQQLTDEKRRLTEDKQQLTDEKQQLTDEKQQLTDEKRRLVEENARLWAKLQALGVDPTR